MLHLDLTLSTPAENLALDEALLEMAEQSGQEYLRLWEPAEKFVVLGRSSKAGQEVHLEYCQSQNIPVLRRCSGGASVVAGAGCLMYAVVLSYELRPFLRMLEQAHAFVFGRLLAGIGPLLSSVAAQGTSDLTWLGKKFSGNSLRCKKSHLLYHGTLLYNFPLQEIGRCLQTPPRQPDYRAGRSHDSFLTNLPLDHNALKTAVRQAFPPTADLAAWPVARTAQLAQQRYSQEDWNFRL